MLLPAWLQVFLLQRLVDGGGPNTFHHGSQDPKLDRDERLDSRKERLGRDEGRLHMERLGGDLDRLGPITRSMDKHIHAQLDEATYGREKTLYMCLVIRVVLESINE